MFKKIKDFLGIEGVKISLTCADEIKRDANHLDGIIKLTSQSNKTVTALTIKLIEKYKRGRKDKILINEYLLSSLDIDLNLQLSDDQVEELKFKLPLNLLKSDMDKFGEKNPIAKGLASFAKKMKGVESYYRLEATAQVAGSSLDAVATRPIVLV